MKLSVGKFLLAGMLGLCALASTSAQEMVQPPVAAQSGDLISQLTPPQFARLSPNGALVGTIARPARDGALRSIPNLEVSLISAGRIVSRVMTNPDGDFSFPQTKPGYYTIVASNPKDLLVFPLTVAASNGDEVEPTLMVTATPIAPSRREAMIAAVLGMPGDVYLPNQVPVPDSRGTAGTYEIAINANGDLVGKMSVLGTPFSQVDMSNMVVRLTREDSIMGEAMVSPEGNFVIPAVSPGPCAFFAFGPQGFIAIGIKLVGGGGIGAVDPAASESFVSMQADAVELNVEIAPIPDVIAGVSVPGDSFSGPVGAPFGPPLGGGGFGGLSGGGGGGGGGGGFGAEGLMGLGAAALAAAALADDDDGFTPPPASPSLP